jgi:hypothetical protein
MHGRRNFLLFVILAATAAAPAVGQIVAPERSGSGTQRAASVPDFSGIWAHPSFPGFEPLASGPTSLRNRSRQYVCGAVNGVVGAPCPQGRGNFNQLVGDYTSPILKPQAAETVRKLGEISLRGATYPLPTTHCWPEPVPYIFNGVAIQMLQQPDKITFLYPNDHQVRRVRMNAAHPAHVMPSWYGDSVGHYEDDTLVIDTVGVKIGPFAVIDMFGTPYTEALHVVERYRLIDYEDAKEGLERDANENLFLPGGADAGSKADPNYRGKHLQLYFTVEDDGVFTMPWSATVTYRRGIEEWREVVCAENTRELTVGGTAATVPRADKPDF